MKTNRLHYFGILAFFILCIGCQKDALKDDALANNESLYAATLTGSDGYAGRQSAPSTCNPFAYIVTLESRTLVNGNWEWVWSVKNSNPGNGSGGTVQDLSHWGMQFGACFNWSSVVSAAYSADGNTWTGFTPSFQADPSQSCMTTPVLKFDYGTSGGAKSYYKLVVNANYVPVSVFGYYKSGANTGCCTFTFSGMGCSSPTEE